MAAPLPRKKSMAKKHCLPSPSMEPLTINNHEVDSTDNDTEHALPQDTLATTTTTAADTINHDGAVDSVFSTTVALCIGMLANSFLLISVFPYSGYMAVQLIASVDAETAGSYAGILASALMIGRATTAYGWGQMADRYGRTTVLSISLFLACILSTCFGLSRTFGWALFFRILLGMSNGMLGTLRTIVSEMAHGDEQLERKTMAVVMGMWSWGFLVFPAMSGALAEPVRQYPNAKYLLQDDQSWVHFVLSRFPFLLPNLLGSIFCFVALVFITRYVKETLPECQIRDRKYILSDLVNWFKSRLCWRQKVYTALDFASPVREKHKERSDDESADLSDESHSSDNSRYWKDDSEEESQPKEAQQLHSKANQPTMCSILSRSETRMYLLVYWSASFVSVAFHEIFPLFCMSRVAGLGLDERQIGQILSLGGLIFAITQYKAQDTAYKCLGLMGSVRAAALLGTPMIFLVPCAILLNKGAEVGSISRSAMLFLALVLAINRICVMVFYSNIAVAMNRSVPPEQRGTTQGVCGMGENIARGLGPSLAGILSSSAVSFMGDLGSLLMFASVGMISVIFSACTVIFLRDVPSDAEIIEKSASSDDDENNDRNL